MADNTLDKVRISLKNDTKSNWTTKNPTLLKGEIGIEFDPSASDNSYTVKFKIGDGTSTWSQLGYFGGEVTLPAPDGTSIVDDNNVWSLAGFGAASAGTFPVKRVTGGTSSIEWVALPSHIGDLDTMYTKLDGIEAGAQVNTVTSVAGKTGAVTLAASDVGLGNVGNFKAVSTVANQGLSTTEQSNARANIGAGTSSFSGSYNDLTNKPTLGTAAAKNVPASGDAASTEVVMGNDSRLTDSRPASDVSAWAKASTKPTYTASEVGAIATSAKGAASGVAELDANGKVPSSQLPSYVDDVLEYDSQSAFPATGETGKIYVAKDTNKTYRWSGTEYVEISASLALGTTSSTAYRGDLGDEAHGWAASALQNVQLNGTALTKSGSNGAKYVNIPIASTSALGVVKAATGNNQVEVNSSTGVMTVHNLSTDKLYQGSNTLVLDCGNATV